MATVKPKYKVGQKVRFSVAIDPKYETFLGFSLHGETGIVKHVKKRKYLVQVLGIKDKRGYYKEIWIKEKYLYTLPPTTLWQDFKSFIFNYFNQL